MASDIEKQLKELQRENHDLRAQLDKIERRDQAVKKAQKQLLRGTWRLLLPLLDRHKVVRSVTQLATTVSGFASERSEWPSKEQILAETREVLESYVRFLIRRRTMVMIFSLLAMVVPGVQIWLVFQQNEIIQNQTDLAEIQVYDIVSRSMTEGDRNARQMTGALLASKLDFLGGVVREAFGPGQSSSFSPPSVSSNKRRLADASFRGYIIHGVVRAIQREGEQGELSERAIHDKVRPMFRLIVTDAGDRMPSVITIGGTPEAAPEDEAEMVDNYFQQMGELLTIYSRLSRSIRRDGEFYDDVRPMFNKLSNLMRTRESRFLDPYRTGMTDFIFDLSQEADFGDPPVDLEAGNVSPAKAFDQGFSRLRNGVGEKAVQWNSFKQQVWAQ